MLNERLHFVDAIQIEKGKDGRKEDARERGGRRERDRQIDSQKYPRTSVKNLKSCTCTFLSVLAHDRERERSLVREKMGDK